MSRRPLTALLALTATATCAPQVVTLNPVTLQNEPRQPSQVPEVAPPTPIEFDEQEAGAEAGTGDQSGRPASLPSKTTVVSDGGSEDEPLPLAEVARRERQRRQDAPPTTISIDDKNIERRTQSTPAPTVRTDGSATPARAEDAPPTAADVDEAQRESTPTDAETERYWRDRVLSLRYDWQDLVAEEQRLESKVNGLRRDYYQEDDGYYRDAEIKPEWDQAWEELQRTRKEIEATTAALERTIEEGRRAGALPGWLREGVEMEPQRAEDNEEDRSLDVTEPIEPDEVTEAAEIDP